MNVINKALEKYVSDMKLSSSDKYVYLLKTSVFGDVLVSINAYSIKTVQVYDISEHYFNKIYSVDYIKGDTLGNVVENVGILDTMDYITIMSIITKYQRDLIKINSIMDDINTATQIDYSMGLNTDELFYNDILLLKKSDGAGRYILNNRVIYISPAVLPGTKKNDLDAVTYNDDVKPYFTVCFTVHKSCDVNVYMRFMKL